MRGRFRGIVGGKVNMFPREQRHSPNQGFVTQKSWGWHTSRKTQKMILRPILAPIRRRLTPAKQAEPTTETVKVSGTKIWAIDFFSANASVRCFDFLRLFDSPLTNMSWDWFTTWVQIFFGFNPHFSAQHFSASFDFGGCFHLVWAPFVADHIVPTCPNAFVASSDCRPDRCTHLLQPASCGGRAVMGAQLTNAVAGPCCGWEFFWCA